MKSKPKATKKQRGNGKEIKYTAHRVWLTILSEAREVYRHGAERE